MVEARVAKRELTVGETRMLRSVFNYHIDYMLVRVYDEKWAFFQPGDTCMTPNGNMYWPAKHYQADFSTANLTYRAWFIHEGAHLYQHYGLRWDVEVRGMFDRSYEYKLDPDKKKLSDYGLEQMGDIARDFYTLKQGGVINKPYTLADYASLLPLT